MFHYLVEEPSNDTSYSRLDFERVLQELERAQVRVLPVAEVWQACAPAAGGRCRFSGGGRRSSQIR